MRGTMTATQNAILSKLFSSFSNRIWFFGMCLATHPTVLDNLLTLYTATRFLPLQDLTLSLRSRLTTR